MISPALTKTRIAVSALMASATLATAGLATSLALSQDSKNNATDSATGDGLTAIQDPSASQSASASPTARSHESDDGDDDHPKAKHTTTSNSGFAPAQRSTTVTKPSHTRTKGS